MPYTPPFTDSSFSGLLGVSKGANFNITSDQAIPISAAKYIVRRVLVVNPSTSLTLAAGGFYTGASKSGTTIVAAAQLYAALTGATKFLDTALALTTDSLTASQIFLSLTVAQGGASTADIYIYGDILV